jgi:hypothetical protein
VVADRDMGDDSDIAQKAAMHGDAATLSQRQLLPPVAVRGDEVEDAAQSPDIDPVIVGELRG